jgi:Trypsin
MTIPTDNQRGPGLTGQPTSPGPSDKGGPEKEQIALEWQRLRFDRQKQAMEFRLKRRELAARPSKTLMEMLANPLTLAIVGGFITLMTTIVTNHLTVSANLQVEATKAELAAKADAAKAELAAKAANQTLQADLIKKFVESPETGTVRKNLEFLVEAGLLPDYADNISKYLKANPGAAPQIGWTTPTLLGGVSSRVEDWPWLVSLYVEGHFFCNGTIIAPRTVLSAAQCVYHRQPASVEVGIAVQDGRYIKIGRRISVTKIVSHPAFSMDRSVKNDIAILELGTALPPPFAMISVQRSADPNIGDLATLATLDPQNRDLTQNDVPIAPNTTCAARLEDKSGQEGKICAGAEGRVACPGTGSAGAPVVVVDAGRKYQIGIVSLGEDCGRRGATYGVYTRVSSYADWIRKIVPNVLSEPMTEVKQ